MLSGKGSLVEREGSLHPVHSATGDQQMLLRNLSLDWWTVKRLWMWARCSCLFENKKLDEPLMVAGSEWISFQRKISVLYTTDRICAAFSIEERVMDTHYFRGSIARARPGTAIM